MRILKFVKKLQKKRYLNGIKKYIDVSTDSIYGDSFWVDLRHPQKGKTYLKIGSQCLIDGNFIFETDSGYIEIGDRCHVGAGTLISRSSIYIGNDVTMAWGFVIYDHNSHAVNWEDRRNDTIQEYNDFIEYKDPIRNKDWTKVKTSSIRIEDKVWIGMNVIVLKGVTIGEGAVIGAGSVVTHDVESWSVVAGNPAKLVRRIGVE